MNFLDQIRDAIKPHADAMGIALNAHSNRIVGELTQIRGHLSDLGRGDIDDLWQRFSVISPGTTGGELVDFQPECRVPIDEIWLIQSISIDAGLPSVLDSIYVSLRNDNGDVILALEGAPFTVSQIVSGAVAMMPGEHIMCNCYNASASGVAKVTMQIIRREIPRRSRNPNLGPKSEMVSNRNTHAIDRDFDGITPRAGWQEAPPVSVESEGLIHSAVRHARLNNGLLDPTQV